MDLSLSQHCNLKELFLLGALAWWDGHGGVWKGVISFTWSHLGKGQVWWCLTKRRLMAKGGSISWGRKLGTAASLKGVSIGIVPISRKLQQARQGCNEPNENLRRN